MKDSVKNLIKSVGFLLVLGLCLTMLSKGAVAHAATGDLKLNVKAASIILEGSYKLKVYNLTENQLVRFRTSDASVAVVSEKGVVKGVGLGNAVIVATVFDNGKAVSALQCEVTIGPAATGIKITKARLVLEVGKQKLLKTIINPLNTVEIPTFYSEDKAVATVSAKGRVRAKETGTTLVYAFLENGQRAVCEINVLSAEDYASYLAGASLEELLESGEDPETEEEDDTEPEDEEITPSPEPVNVSAQDTGKASNIE